MHIYTRSEPGAQLDSSLVKGVSFHPASVLGLFEAKEAHVFDGDLPSSSSTLSFHRNFSSLMCLPPPLSTSCHPSFPRFFSPPAPVFLPKVVFCPDGGGGKA